MHPTTKAGIVEHVKRATPKGQARKPASLGKGLTMKNYYTLEELNAIMFSEEERAVNHSIKYRKLREKFADMPQEQFDDYYHAFVGTNGVIGGHPASVTPQQSAMFNAIVEWFNSCGKYYGAASVSDIMISAYKNCTDKPMKKAINPAIKEVKRWNGSIYYSIVESFHVNVRKFLLALAEQGEIEHIEIKTRGMVHLNMFKAK